MYLAASYCSTATPAASSVSSSHGMRTNEPPVKRMLHNPVVSQERES